MSNESVRPNVTVCEEQNWNWVFACLIVVQYPMAIITVLVNAMFLSLVTSVKLFAPNVRLLTISSSSAAVLVALTFLGRAFYGSVAMAIGFSRIHMSSFTCYAIDAPFGIFSTVFVLSMLVLAAERLYDTWRPHESDKPDFIVQIFTVLTWLVSPCWTINSLFDAFTAQSQFRYCFCTASFVHERSDNWTGKGLYISAEVLTVVLICVVQQQNRSRLADFNLNTKHHSLALRFTASNNVKTTSSLLPYVLCYVICYTTFITVGFGINQALKNGDGRQSMVSVNLQIVLSLFFLLGVAVGPYIWICYHSSMRALALKRYQFLRYLPSRRAQGANDVKSIAGDKKVRHANAVEYRVKPELHNRILEGLWQKKY